MMALDKKRAGALIVALIILVAILFAFSKKNETAPAAPGAETSVIEENAAEEAAQNAASEDEARQAQDKMRQLIMEQRMEALKRQEKTGK